MKGYTEEQADKIKNIFLSYEYNKDEIIQNLSISENFYYELLQVFDIQNHIFIEY